MAINEACQVWIEQRIQEDVQEGKDLERSVCSISTEIASEVSRIFQTAINPEAIRAKIRRMQSRLNGRSDVTAENDAVKSGYTGDKLEPAQVVEKVDALVAKGVSVREAAAKVAGEAGKKSSAVRQAYSREKERINRELKGSVAMHFAARAIQHLTMIPLSAPDRLDAITWAWNLAM